MGFAALNPSYIETMHDIRWIRENPAEFDQGLERRRLPRQSAEVLALDKEWRGLQTVAEEAQAVRNRLSREIGAAKARGEIRVRRTEPEPALVPRSLRVRKIADDPFRLRSRQ